MKDLDSFLTERLQKRNQTHVETLADRKEAALQSRGFGVIPLDAREEEALYEILSQNKGGEKEAFEEDVKTLKRITQEVKAIDGQAILLHGERIKRAQVLLKGYKEGAFTSWLLAVYKNRQTPYNFLQYYEFYQSLTEALREKIVQMPKQAIYTLASRQGAFATKQALVEKCYQEPKEVILQTIRTAFPLPQKDARKQRASFGITSLLEKAILLAEEESFSLLEKEKLESLLDKLKSLLKKN